MGVGVATSYYLDIVILDFLVGSLSLVSQLGLGEGGFGVSS